MTAPAMPARRHSVKADDLLREVLPPLAEGLSVEEMGQRLHLSSHGVKARLRGLYTKLGARNAVHAVHLAHERGWL